MLDKLFGRNKSPTPEEEAETERADVVDRTLDRADEKMGEAGTLIGETKTLIREARSAIAEQEKERYARELRLQSGRGGKSQDELT